MIYYKELFVNRTNRLKYISKNNKESDNKKWLNELIDSVKYDKQRLLTPQFVKRLSKTLIITINTIICEKETSNTIIRDYFESKSSLSSFCKVLLFTLIKLLGTFVLPESINMKSLQLSFHSKIPIKTPDHYQHDNNHNYNHDDNHNHNHNHKHKHNNNQDDNDNDDDNDITNTTTISTTIT